MYKNSFFFAFVLFYFSAQLVNASVTINEIMYDLEGTDTDREWVEVYNSGTSQIDLSTWKFFENNSNHSLVPFDGGSTIAPNGYAVIVDKPEKFKADWPNFSGVLFDSSFSLNNDPGEELSLKDNTGVIVDTVTYITAVGAQGDGKTLNRSGSVFVTGSATAGVENITTQDDTNDDNTDDEEDPPPSDSGGSVTRGTIPPQKQTETTIPKINAQITSKLSVIAGTPIIFEPKVIGYSGESLTQGTFFWNFGDGMSLEKNVSEKIIYTYNKSGEYVVSLEYTRGQYQIEPDATDRIVIQVTEPSVVVSSIGSDGSVEITNKSSREVDLSGWVVQADTSSFTFPKNTIILAGRKISLSPTTTHFGTGIQSVSILLPNKQTASVYPEVKKDIAVKSSNISHKPLVIKNDAVTSNNDVLIRDTVSSTSDEYIPLVANATDAIDASSIKTKHILLIAILIVLLGSGIGGILYIRKIRTNKSSADDFELVD